MSEREKGGPAELQLTQLATCIDRGLDRTESQRAALVPHLDMLTRINTCLELDPDTVDERKRRFSALQGTCRRQAEDPICQHMADVMKSFKPGLFVGPKLPADNLDLERFFRLPKAHERRINGHAHAGVRLVHEGATLVLTLDAHANRPEPFTAEDLRRYLHSPVPESQRQAKQRRTIMRAARSKKKRPALLALLEQRYRSG